ncbi:MAG: hypothetical protein QM742_08945 [Aquabacterium sp.]
MSAAPIRSQGRSPWRRTRYWTTLACLTALVAGLLTLAAGHPMHGWLMMLGALMLVKGTIWGRRSRRHTEMPMLAEHVDTEAAAPRKWREVA